MQQNNASTRRWEGEETQKKWKHSFIPLNPFVSTTTTLLVGLSGVLLSTISATFAAYLIPFVFFLPIPPAMLSLWLPLVFNPLPVCPNPAAAEMRRLQWIKRILPFWRSFPLISTQSLSEYSNKQPAAFSSPFEVKPNLSLEFNC